LDLINEFHYVMMNESLINNKLHMSSTGAIFEDCVTPFLWAGRPLTSQNLNVLELNMESRQVRLRTRHSRHLEYFKLCSLDMFYNCSTSLPEYSIEHVVHRTIHVPCYPRIAPAFGERVPVLDKIPNEGAKSESYVKSTWSLHTVRY
jgi:hypothetical protein